MHCFDNRFVIVCVTIGFVFINCENDFVKDESKSEKDEDITPEDLYSFIALIDLVFTDGMKKSCTGTIIHDYVVITAAHCFQVDEDNIIQTELTASFVVIGTKKMFDTGYEQYLPIERVIIHPNYKRWTADLALVYTFAGMMSDKPGLIVPLASEKTITPVDSDVTVFSWGQFEINTNMAPTFTSKIENNSGEDRYEVMDKFSPGSDNIETSKTPSKENNRQRQRRKKRKNRKRIRQRKQNTANLGKYRLRQSSVDTQSKYRQRPTQQGNTLIFDSEAELLGWEKKRTMKVPTTETYRSSRQSFRATSYYRNNWRRNTGDQRNQLAVEIFSFVNMQMCKKLVEKAMSSLYELKNPNEVLCYASEAHFVTEVQLLALTLLIILVYTNLKLRKIGLLTLQALLLEPDYEDSGAPAMRRGRLVAVTVGGVNIDGERVAVGLKMTCFCSWIAENIPVSGTKWKCCKNCCEAKDDTEHTKHTNDGKIRLKAQKTNYELVK